VSELVATTNYAAIIRPLQVLAMVIVILFFARVLRVSSLQAQPSDKEKSHRRSHQLALEFIEPVDRAGERVEIESAVTLGRSPECDLSLQDTYLSSRHARFSNEDGELTIEDLGSTNGTYVNQEIVEGRYALERGDIVQLGGVLFEVVR
jgi:predicted component of type VI protein secretion system